MRPDRPSTPGRYVLASVLVHATLFAAAVALGPRGGASRVPATVAAAWEPPPPPLEPPPEPPPEAPPVPERFEDEVADVPEEPAPLDAVWVPETIAVTSSTGDVLARTPRAARRVRGVPGGTGTGQAPAPPVAAAPPPPPPEPPPAPPPEPVVRVAARAVEIVKPDYPEAARASGVEGAVLLEVDVSAEGTIEDVRVISSSGSGILDRAAIDAVRKWRFEPATVNGEPVPTTVRLRPIRFRLES